jgi:hypothetical protein
MKGLVQRGFVMWALATLLFAGCGDKTKTDVSDERLKEMAGGELKEVVEIRGTIFLDGEPTEGINLSLYDAATGKQVSTARTDADGKYCWSTYDNCDGVAPGEYVVTFTYVPKQKKNDTGADEFGGKYGNIRGSKFKVTVESGKPQTTVNYELEGKKK